MQLNSLGLVAALTAFLTIWFGHVAVRKIEFVSPTIWLPTVIFAAFGIGLEFLSLSTVARPLSAVFGIAGITLLFDALEFTRQQRRIRRGHAPANPKNPRHARILAEPNSHATTLDLLKREPGSHVVSSNASIKFIERH
jgi:hypothetical protein